MASARVLVLAAVLLACLLAVPTVGWRRRRRRRAPPPCPAHTSALPGAINSWDQTFTFTCPPGKVISRIQSAHCNTAEDRVWKFECRAVPGISSGFQEHFWTPWVNDYDGVMDFTCPFNSVVTGFKSEHSDGQEDRRWKVQCSKSHGMVTENHALTPYQNDWDAVMDYSTTHDYYLRGIHSDQDNYYGDRRYKFDICKLRMNGC